MPFLPLYIQQDFGIEDPHEVTMWAGIIFGANFLTAGLVSPIWGNLADKHGRKIMILRSGYFMSITVALTGFAGKFMAIIGFAPGQRTGGRHHSCQYRVGCILCAEGENRLGTRAAPIVHHSRYDYGSAIWRTFS